MHNLRYQYRVLPLTSALQWIARKVVDDKNVNIQAFVSIDVFFWGGGEGGSGER